MESEEHLREMLDLQLSEIEMLSSMYPNDGEFILDDPISVEDVKMFLDEKIRIEDLSSRIGFTLNLQVGNKENLEVVCRLPHDYPGVAPQVYLRAIWLSKADHRTLSDELQTYISSLENGELAMCYIIDWLRENTESYISYESSIEDKKTKNIKGDTHFTRMWIYSHHIYSKWKRSDILSFSKELVLTGFSMPGKPGIVAIEGSKSNVEEFWSRIRRMQWKHLVMKEREDFELDDKCIDDLRVFSGFEEKSFEPRQSKGRGAHADRGLLFQFMKEHGCAHIFPMYFGVEGKCGDHDSD